MQKLLSVVVPTLNRRGLLEKTLDYLVSDIRGHEADVELIVINNASDDDTAEFLRRWSESAGFFSVSYDERVDIDASFKRCVEQTSGRYINIFGDDDLPIPGLISRLLSAIRAQEGCAFVYMNRLIGDDSLNDVHEIAHPRMGVEMVTYPVSDFIRIFTHWPGFITALVFDRECWASGEDYYRSDFKGYQFLARVYAGARGRYCLYVGMPWLVQRRGVQAWKKDWPQYWLVNMPRLLEALDTAGSESSALKSWQVNETSLKRVFVDCVVAKAYNYSVSSPFWADAARYQPKSRALFIRLVQFLVPVWFAKGIYFNRGKYARS